MSQIFFDRLRLPDTVIQVGGVNKIDRVIGLDKEFNLEDFVASENKNIYFLGGIREGVNGRASDRDVIKKNYVCFDFDIRENEKKAGRECSDKRLEEIAGEILNALSQQERYKDYSYALLSGNGMHVYFFGHPVEITGAETFKAGMSFLVEEIGSFAMKPDPACVNVGRIMRLPGSTNTKNGIRTRFVESREIESSLVAEVIAIGENELEKQTRLAMERIMSLKPVVTGDDLYAAINNIPIQDLVSRLMNWEFDGDRHFTEPGSTKKKACFIARDGNFIVHGGTDHFSDQQKGYSPYQFVKMILGLSDRETFEWFKNEYSHIRELDEQNVQMRPSGISSNDFIKVVDIDKKDDEILMDKSIFKQGTYFSKVLEYTAETTDASTEFIITASLVAAATVLKGNVYFLFGNQRIRPHLFAVILGQSSLTRKTTAINIAKKIIKEFQNLSIMRDAWSEQLSFSDEITPECFIELLSEQPCGFFTYSEIRGFLARMEKTYMGGHKEMLTELYDCPDEYKRTRKDRKGEPITFSVKNPTINILAGSTMDWFISGIDADDIASGFMPRFIFAHKEKPPEKTLLIPKNADEEKLSEIATHLQILAQEWHEEKVFSDGSKEIYLSWAHEIDREMRKQENPNLDAFYARLNISAIKMAMIIEGLLRVEKYIHSGSGKFDNSNFISEEGMICALELANYYKKVCHRLVTKEFAFTEHDKTRLKIIRIIKRCGGEIQKRELLRAMGGSVEFLNKVLGGMKEAGYIDWEDKRTIAGQNTTIIRITK